MCFTRSIPAHYRNVLESYPPYSTESVRKFLCGSVHANGGAAMHGKGKAKSCVSKEQNYHTQASEASKIVPSVQKRDKITIQVPRLCAGTNSKNQDMNTWLPPTPTPTRNRRATKHK